MSEIVLNNPDEKIVRMSKDEYEEFMKIKSAKSDDSSSTEVQNKVDNKEGEVKEETDETDEVRVVEEEVKVAEFDYDNLINSASTSFSTSTGKPAVKKYYDANNKLRVRETTFENSDKVEIIERFNGYGKLQSQVFFQKSDGKRTGELTFFEDGETVSDVKYFNTAYDQLCKHLIFDPNTILKTIIYYNCGSINKNSHYKYSEYEYYLNDRFENKGLKYNLKNDILRPSINKSLNKIIAEYLKYAIKCQTNFNQNDEKTSETHYVDYYSNGQHLTKNISYKSGHKTQISVNFRNITIYSEYFEEGEEKGLVVTKNQHFDFGRYPELEIGNYSPKVEVDTPDSIKYYDCFVLYKNSEYNPNEVLAVRRYQSDIINIKSDYIRKYSDCCYKSY